MTPIDQLGRPHCPQDRAASAAVLAACAMVLGLASWMDPSPDGLGTHTQLGLPACGFYSSVGLPCATCGMTTAFSHAAHGRLLSAFRAQPAGAVLAVMTAMLAVTSAYALATGMRLDPTVAWAARPAVVVAAAGVVLAAWGYKMAFAQWVL